MGLLSMVVALALFALTFAAGYSALLTREYSRTVTKLQDDYLDNSAQQLRTYWEQNSFEIDGPGSTDLTGDELFQRAGGSFKYQAAIVLSNRLIDPSDPKLAYRNAVLILPTEDDRNTPLMSETFDREEFITTGVLPACTNQTCEGRKYRLVNGLDIERRQKVETIGRLSRVALKAQAYFKARMLQNPERTISINYFYKPSGACLVNEAMDLGCFDVYTQLAGVSRAESKVLPSEAALKLGLGSEELLSAWGMPFEFSNSLDSETLSPPFSMSFRARTTSGDYLIVNAIQQL